MKFRKKNYQMSLKNLHSNKTLGNDGLTKEFCEAFWRDLKKQLLNAINQAKTRKKLITSQRQAIIKLIGNKGRNKGYLKNWRSTSLLTLDYKIISKFSAARLKDVLPDLISLQ